MILLNGGAVDTASFFCRYILKEFEHSPPLADDKRIIYLKYKN